VNYQASQASHILSLILNLIIAVALAILGTVSYYSIRDRQELWSQIHRIQAQAMMCPCVPKPNPTSP
jgi:hypothetical protein